MSNRTSFCCLYVVMVIPSVFLFLLLTRQSSAQSQCYTSSNCIGDTVPAVDARGCCVGTNDGQSYGLDPGDCQVSQCIVHGFVNATYDVVEGRILDTFFKLNVKGETELLNFSFFGVITAVGGGTSSSSDFEPLLPVLVIYDTDSEEVHLFTINDEITLEYDDSIILNFTSNIPFSEDQGELIRDTAVVNIIDNDRLEINFEELDYSTEEGGTLSNNIRLQFRNNQNTFTLTLCPMNVDTVDYFMDNFEEISKATAGDDFTNTCIEVSVPAATTSGPQTYIIEEFFDVIDDNINEVEQSFALVAEIGDDVTATCFVEGVGVTECSCFQTAVGVTDCLGKTGATEIRITDNDYMVIGFTERSQTVSESDVFPDADSLLLFLSVTTLRVSEREYGIVYRLLSSGTANVISFDSGEHSDFDAVFDFMMNNSIHDFLFPGESEIRPEIRIVNDPLPEEEECFSIQIAPVDIPGLRELFQCDYVDWSTRPPTNYSCQHTICIKDDDDPFEVGFVATAYNVSESVGSVEVCVNLTQPQIDILDEYYVVVEVTDFPSSVYIPSYSFIATPDEPNFFGQYSMVPLTDYPQQTIAVNAIDDEIIRENQPNEIRSIVCYNQVIYNDTRLEADEWLGLTLDIDYSSVFTIVRPMYDQVAILIRDNDRAEVGLEEVVHGVSESLGAVLLCAVVSFPLIECPIEFPFNLSFSTCDRLAVSPMDYVSVSETLLMFDACETQRCITITIMDDDEDEQNEQFFYTLERTPDLHPNIELVSVDGLVVIVDDDDIIEVGYEDTVYTSSETQQMVELNIVINKPVTGRAPRPFNVTVTTISFTAESPDDYEAVSAQIIQFNTGDKSKKHTIAINQDKLCEGREDLELFYSNIALNNDTELINIKIYPSRAEVLIRDPFNCGYVQCYSSNNCSGDTVPAGDVRDCCVGTDDGLSFSDSGHCFQCIVHGFVNAKYDVVEEDLLQSSFQLNVKGNTKLNQISVSGIITTTAGGTSSLSDFESLTIFSVTNDAEFSLFTTNDEITLEYDDTIILNFIPRFPNFIADLEAQGEFIRDTVVVNIIDNDRLEINFEEPVYSIVEGGNLNSDIHLSFRNNQNPFTLTLCPMNIVDTDFSRATAGQDFSDNCTEVTVPAATTPGPQTYTIEELFFDVIDDNINEVEQSFALVAEIGNDVRAACFVEGVGVTECSCFQTAIDCLGNIGATEIRIIDNDPMIIGFTERRQTVSESGVFPGVDAFILLVDVIALRVSEREHAMLYRLLFSGNATVMPFHFGNNVDAHFGSIDSYEINVLLPGESMATQLRTDIINDIIPEGEECYSIQISPVDTPGVRELFTCNTDDLDATNLFCEHTICIEDDDEPFEVGFVETVYAVFENVGSVEVCVNLTQPQIDILEEYVVVEVTDFPSSVYINGTLLATPDMPTIFGQYPMMPMTDYSQQTLGTNAIDDEKITEIMRIVCYDQPIYDDECFDGDEWLGLTLDIGLASILTTVKPLYDQAAILIKDDDRAVIGLEQTLFNVSENIDAVELCVNISFPRIDCPITFPFNISLVTQDGTAVTPNDYEAINETLMFNACETRHCVNVTIVDDFETDQDENFSYILERTSSLHSNIELYPVEGQIIINDNDICYTSSNCIGDTVPAVDARECCVETNDGQSYGLDPGDCQVSQCIVHGFHYSIYNASESDTLQILFKNNVKGQTRLPYLNFSGIITAAPGGSASELDYEEFVPINTTATISTAFNLKIIDDDIAMEMNESIILSFMPLGSNSILEPEGEYIRNLATVNIIDNDKTCSEDDCSSSSSSLTSGIIALIVVIPVIILICVIAILVVIVCLRRKKKAYATKKISKVDNSYTIKETEFGSLEPSQISSSSQQSLIQQLQKELSKKHMLFQKHHVDLGKIVGQGESGIVYRGCINIHGQSELVAIKTGKALQSVADKERLLKEVSIMLSFNHPNVMPLTGLCIEGEMPLLIMPFMTKGNVLEYVKQHRGTLYIIEPSHDLEIEVARKTCLGICHQIAKGMTYLAKYKFVHRDLAARNCMIDSDGVIKVTDFGLTEDMYGTNYFRRERNVGGNEEKVPIRWMAPESIEADLYDETTDVWSFGVTCWEVFTCGSVPYAGVPVLTLRKELISGHRLEKPSNTICSDEIYDLMKSCWYAQSAERPKFTHLTKQLSQLLDSDPAYMKLGNL